MNRLTTRAVAALPIPPVQTPRKVYRRFDGGGLYVEARDTGQKMWGFKFQYAGKERRMSLGSFPDVSLKDARQRRDDMRQKLRAGIDPVAERREAKSAVRRAHAHTVRAFVEHWIAEHAAGWSAGYAMDVRRAFELHLFPRLGSRPMASVQADELRQVLRDATAGGRRYETVRRLRQRCEDIWSYAQVARIVTENIAAPLKAKGMLPKPEVQGFAPVPEDELPAILVALRGYGNVLIESAFLLQLLTASRPGEARGARWDEIDLDAGLWSLPSSRMKEGKEHVVPLSPQAIAVLRRLKPLSARGPVVFPSRSRPSVPMSDNVVGQALRRLGYDVTAHGLRKLFSTVCHEHGKDSVIIERCLAHVDKNTVRGTYNKAEYLPQRRELLHWWGDRVERLCAEYTTSKGLLPIFPLPSP